LIRFGLTREEVAAVHAAGRKILCLSRRNFTDLDEMARLKRWQNISGTGRLTGFARITPCQRANFSYANSMRLNAIASNASRKAGLSEFFAGLL